MKLQWLTHFCFSILYQPPGYMYCLCFKTLKSDKIIFDCFATSIPVVKYQPLNEYEVHQFELRVFNVTFNNI
jgi:hypothetical protein